MFRLFIAFALLFACQISDAANQPQWDTIKILNGGSLGANLSSTVVDLKDTIGYSVQCVWTGGTASGTIKISVSNDNVDAGSSVTNFSTLSDSSQTISGAGDFMWNIGLAQYRWMKIFYSRSGGTGSITCNFGRKV